MTMGAPAPAPVTAPTAAPAPAAPPPNPAQVQDNETVSGQLRQLLSTGSPLLEQSKNRALIQAGSRGMQNSTLAVQAGEQAFIGAAAPIAAADAGTYSERALVNLQGDINSRLQKEQAGYAMDLSTQEGRQRLAEIAAQGDVSSRLQLEQSAQRLTELAAQGDINSKLQLEQFGYNTKLSAQENLQRMSELAAQGDIQARLALQNFEFQSLLSDKEAGNAIKLEDARFQNQQKLMVEDYAQKLGLSQAEQTQTIERMNLQHQQTLEQIKAQAEAQGTDTTARLGSQYLASVSDRMNQGSNEVASIYQQEGLSPDQQRQAVENATARMNADITALQTFYQQSPLWDDSWGTAAPPAGTPPAGTPGYTPMPSLPPMPGYPGLPLYPGDPGYGAWPEIR